MANTKEIRGKIASIKSTQKITNAMEKVATSKMRNAQNTMNEGRPYSNKIRELIGHVADSNTDYRHPFLETRAVNRIGYIVISSDRGLCGGLNTNMFKALVRDMQLNAQNNVEIDLCTIGSKANSFFKNFGGNVVATASLSENLTVGNIIGATKIMMDLFLEKKVDKLILVYNKFVSTMIQEPVLEQLVPLVPVNAESLTDSDTEKKAHHIQTYNKHSIRWDYIYEPSPAAIIDELLRRYIESQVFQALKENMASEQAARMLAMKNATDNAGNIIGELQLIYNKVRQAAITQEISEIVGGASAV